jgi:hypothetical protein
MIYEATQDSPFPKMTIFNPSEIFILEGEPTIGRSFLYQS